jgi:hypothetical protein
LGRILDSGMKPEQRTTANRLKRRISVIMTEAKKRAERRKQIASETLKRVCSESGISINMEDRNDVFLHAARFKFLASLPFSYRHMSIRVLELAQKGDRIPLAEHIKTGGRITPEMRSFLADVLLGVAKRPRKTSTALRDVNRFLLLKFVERARKRGDKDVPQQAERSFLRTWRHLQKELAAAKAEARINDAHLYFKLFDKADEFRLCFKRLTEHAKEQNWGVIRYPISDTALDPHTLA